MGALKGFTYGFGVYRASDGERISANALADENIFEKWTLGLLPFNEKEFALTEDGELLVIDKPTGQITRVPAEGKLVVQYGGGELEKY